MGSACGTACGIGGVVAAGTGEVLATAVDSEVAGAAGATGVAVGGSTAGSSALTVGGATATGTVA